MRLDGTRPVEMELRPERRLPLPPEPTTRLSLSAAAMCRGDLGRSTVRIAHTRAPSLLDPCLTRTIRGNAGQSGFEGEAGRTQVADLSGSGILGLVWSGGGETTAKPLFPGSTPGAASILPVWPLGRKSSPPEDTIVQASAKLNSRNGLRPEGGWHPSCNSCRRTARDGVPPR